MEDNKVKIKKIETYADDMARAIKDDKSGLIRKIIHEEEKHEEEKQVSVMSKRNKVFVILSTLLFLSAFGILIFLFFFMQGDVPSVSMVSTPEQIVFTDKTNFISIDNLNKEKIIEILNNQIRNTELKMGGIGGIYLTESGKVVGFNKFNDLLKTSLDLKNKVISDNFLFGSYNSGLSSISVRLSNPFLILKVTSFPDAFNFMRNWETRILHDFGDIFGVKLSTETNYLFTKDFEDKIIANKNARVLHSKYGDIVLMYVFVDDNTIIIANSNETINELILRLNTGQIKK